MSRTAVKGSILFLAVCLVVVGCKKKSVPSNGNIPAVEQTGPPITDDECRDYAQKLSIAINGGDRDTVSRLLRLGELVDRSLSSLEITPNEKNQMLRGAANDMNQLPELLINAIKNGGSYSLLHIHEVQGRRRVLMRMLASAGNVNYHDIILARFPDGNIGAEDMFVYMTGELLGQTVRNVALPLVAENRQGILERLSGTEKVYSKNAGTIQAISSDLQGGQYQQALAKIRSLPPEVQNLKTVQMMGLKAAQGTKNNDEYMKELQRFHNNHPDDPTVELVVIDYYCLRKEFDKALKSIDLVDKSLGGDPYLWVLKSSLMIQMGRLPEAKAQAEKAIEGDPSLVKAYLFRVTISLKENNHADTLYWLKKGIEAGAIQTNATLIRGTPDYAGFVKSKQFGEFETWMKSRR